MCSLVESETAGTLRLSSFSAKSHPWPSALSPVNCSSDSASPHTCCGLPCWESLDCKNPTHHQLHQDTMSTPTSEGLLAHGVDPEPHPILPHPRGPQKSLCSTIHLLPSFLAPLCGSVAKICLSDSLRSHGWQHTRLPCPLLSPGVCSNSCPLSQ